MVWGIARLGNCLRADLREDMCVEGNRALAPVLRIPAHCCELHPGLCRFDDAAIFQEALDLAGILHDEARSLGIGSFVGVHTCRYSRIFCISMIRLRDPPIVVFAECDLSFEDPNLVTFSIQREELVFETSYAIARDATYGCEGGLHQIAMTQLRVRSVPQTPLQVEILARDHKILRGGRDAEGRVDGHGGDDGDDRPDGHGRGGGRGGRDARGAGGDLLDILGAAEDREVVRRPPRPREGGIAILPPPPPVAAHEPAVPLVDAVDDGSELEGDLDYQYEPEEELEEPRDDVHDLVAEALAQPPPAVPASSSSGAASSSSASSSSGAASSSSAPSSSGAASSSGAVPVALPPPPLPPPILPPPLEVPAADQPADAAGAVAVAADPRPRARRAGRDGYPKLWVPGSDEQIGIRLSDNLDGTKDMRAICNLCSATLSRTCRLPTAGRAAAGSKLSGQGSPLGKLWAWAKKGLELGRVHSAADHTAFVPNLDQRASARGDVELLLPVSADWIAAEREGSGAPGYPEPVLVS